MTALTYTDKIAEIVSQNSLLETALKRFDIPKSVQNPSEISWETLGTDGKFLLEVIWAFDDPKTFKAQNFNTYSFSIILDYLKKTHTYYLDKRLGEIEQSLLHIQKKCETEEESLYWQMVHLLYNAWRRHLILHVEQEESTLFPYIEKLINAREDMQQQVDDAFTLEHFVHHHEDDPVEIGLKEIKQAVQNRADNYESAPLSIKILLTQLDAFERDLWVHGMIEDDVLVPKALKIEQEVRA